MGPSYLAPEHLISTFGLLGILAVVFAESGLLIGFFLPGDSLLFTAGLLVAGGHYLQQPLWLVCLLVSVAATAGDQVGYLVGRTVGPTLFRRADSRLFRQDNLTRARVFFDSYGARSVVLARFVPVVRTFTPVVAGASTMQYRSFAVFNVIGGVLWGSGLTVLGYFLGQIAFVKDHIELMLLGVVAISVIPIGIHGLRARHARRGSPAAAMRGDQEPPESPQADSAPL
ncbi:DedA family protein [Kineosporia succinea]|uniref:Membrane-associated protein n=1 Tax=Kineosporia succinea TaxID=84632 RepID=A0ABT9PCB2_9ACTN|nr:VTT domain-containing protein [Kineosporia succinea]MDP9830352.1 membrane-associated protein [Kineosporia succinea]